MGEERFLHARWERQQHIVAYLDRQKHCWIESEVKAAVAA
jgi:hypothetical protein